MSHPLVRVTDWKPIDPALAMQRHTPSVGSGTPPPPNWSASDRLPPVLLYCYLKARFGRPNGFMMFLRTPSSGNLIHWHWALEVDGHVLNIWAPSRATEFIVHSTAAFTDDDRDQLMGALTDDTLQRAKEISAEKKQLEPWALFINPYHRLDACVGELLADLDRLGQVPRPPALTMPADKTALDDYQPKLESWQRAQFSSGRICTSIRMMAPVLGEAFVNLILFVLAKPDVRKDQRLYEDLLRRAIDVRVRGLHLNCIGFQHAVDPEHQAFEDFHTVMNARNDILHGNVDPQRLYFDEVYFEGTIPIFPDNEPQIHRVLRGLTKHVEPEVARKDVAAVRAFVEYVQECLAAKVHKQVELMLRVPQLGVRKDTGRLGVLFPETVVEGFAVR